MEKADITIIGGGAAGALAAWHLAKSGNQKIYIVEPDDSLGLGKAYASPYDWHVLNVRAFRMAIDSSQPGLFLEWIESFPEFEKYLYKDFPDHSFVPRWLFGRFLQDQLQPFIDRGQITWIKEAALAVERNPAGFKTTTTTQTIPSKFLILCTGIAKPRALNASGYKHYLDDPWEYESIGKLLDCKSIGIVGTGLTMVDAVLSLHHLGFKGKIEAISRKGLIPRSYLQQPVPVIRYEKIPQKSLLTLLMFVRSEVKKHSFISVINALRPHVQSIWKNLSLKDRRQFFRHLSSFWDTHRHRIAPEPSAIIQGMIKSGQLKITKGRTPPKTEALINCTGPGALLTDAPLLNSMVKNKMLAVDDLQMGFKIDDTCESTLCPKLFLVGQLIRGTLLEITAVPEIAAEVKNIAALINKEN